jgi:hypothetical protein
MAVDIVVVTLDDIERIRNNVATVIVPSYVAWAVLPLDMDECRVLVR